MKVRRYFISGASQQSVTSASSMCLCTVVVACKVTSEQGDTGHESHPHGLSSLALTLACWAMAAQDHEQAGVNWEEFKSHCQLTGCPLLVPPPVQAGPSLHPRPSSPSDRPRLLVNYDSPTIDTPVSAGTQLQACEQASSGAWAVFLPCFLCVFECLGL